MLREHLIAAAKAKGTDFAFVVKNLKTGEMWEHNSYAYIKSASLIKVFIMLEALNRVQERYLTIDTEIEVKAEDVVPFSVLEFLRPRKYQLEELLRLMIVYSDNTATNVLIDFLGIEEINRRIRQEGFEKSILQRKMMDFEAAKAGKENLTVPAEMYEFLQRLYDGKLLGDRYDELMIDIMKGQADEADMRLYLPDEIPIARKCGELGCLNHEISIVFGDKTDYIYCFFSWNGKSNNETRKLMSDTSRIVYDFLNV